MRAALPRRIAIPKSQVSASHRSLSTSRAPLRRTSPTFICQSCRNKLARPAVSSLSTRRFQSTSTSTTSNTIESPFASSAPKTHYDFFPLTLPNGPPPSGPFTIDLRQLRKEFLQLQAKAHPDLHASHNKARAEALSSRINEAYKTLSDPLLRTQYLLRLQGIDVESETDKTVDKELLMAVMEVREAVEEAQQVEEIEQLKEENGERIRASLVVIEKGFAKEDLGIVREEAVRLKYWRNCEESLKAWD